MANTSEQRVAAKLRRLGSASKRDLMLDGLTSDAVGQALQRLKRRGMVRCDSKSHSSVWHWIGTELPKDGRGLHGNFNRSPENIARLMRNLKHVIKDGRYVPRVYDAPALARAWGWGCEKTVRPLPTQRGVE